MERVIRSFLIIWMFCSSPCSGSGKLRKALFFNGPCYTTQFRCLNNVCIDRYQFCNGKDDCGDNSDEIYCRGSSPQHSSFIRCQNSYQYIPSAWKCDGINDCRCDGARTDCSGYLGSQANDEYNCENQQNLRSRVMKARKRAMEWINNQAQNRTSTDRWGPHVTKTAVALYLADPQFAFLNMTAREMAHELSIQLLSKFALKKMKDVNTAHFAPYINALLVTCVDPRKFHSIDLVNELRERVNAQKYSNPYDILTLCNAREEITDTDVNKLRRVFRDAQRQIWTGTQAIAVMALVCAGNQPGSNFTLQSIKEFTGALKEKQYRNGTVENLQTTVLVMQALFASEPEEDENNFDEEKALLQILSEQRDDGSFGSIVDTYYALPVLNGRSLVNISSHHCVPYIKDEDTGLQDLMNHHGTKMVVRYTLWIGDEKDVERTIKLRIPTNSSFYGIMEVARDIDSQYRFQYVVKNTKPYITVLSGMSDDPETGRFWFPYIYNQTKPTPVILSPADLILKDKDHVVMWYRSGSWIE